MDRVNNLSDGQNRPNQRNHNVVPLETAQSLPSFMQRTTCLNLVYDYMLVPIFLYNAIYFWPVVDKNNADLYYWMRVT